MANHDVIDLSGKKVGSIELHDQVFAAPIKKYLLTEVVQWQRAKARRGTQSVKTRTEVNGTTKKPYGQKHTGNARQGDEKAPHFRGGGVAFAPKPRDYEYAMPKAKRRAALACALTLKVKEGNLRVVKSFELREMKTKAVKGALDALKTGCTLIVDADNEKLAKSARNLADSRYLNVNGLNVVDLLRYPSLVMTEAAVQTITQRLLGE
ncbi:MAG: 50S ribosomal protein L4 [Deltaproteobacteria bacterium]|nr:50S ribosomal protein L4 [Deltaproteobacteria bacterium]